MCVCSCVHIQETDLKAAPKKQYTDKEIPGNKKYIRISLLTIDYNPKQLVHASTYTHKPHIIHKSWTHEAPRKMNVNQKPHRSRNFAAESAIVVCLHKYTCVRAHKHIGTCTHLKHDSSLNLLPTSFRGPPLQIIEEGTCVF